MEIFTQKTQPTPVHLQNDDAAVFTITLSGGLANRNRLPIDQVVRTLQEFQDMVREVGKRIQRDAGVENATGDFGLEIVAGPTGAAFQKGSVKATTVATIDVANAAKTFAAIIRRAQEYARKPLTDDDPQSSIIARRMLTMAKLQAPARSLVAFTLRGGAAKVQKASLNERVFLHLQKASKKLMTIEALQLYGRLRQLNDRSKTENTDGHFWGQLVTDTGEVWRLRFTADMLSRVVPLFMRQIVVNGDATYFGPAKNPRLAVRFVDKDPERRYVEAFDALRETGDKIFGDATTEELLAELYG